MITGRLFPSLEDSDRIVITGATGWLGREILNRLSRFRPEIQVLPIASRSQSFISGGFTYSVSDWSQERISDWRPTIALHLAYLTRETESSIGVAEYARRNQSITQAATHLYSIPEMRAVVVASSGAALQKTHEIYGTLKSRDEQIFTTLNARTGVPTVISRIWSVSGAFCTKPEMFALFDLIDQTKFKSTVHIRARGEVWRRYVDAGEFLEICLTTAAAGQSTVIDSAGELIEIGQLARRIQQVLGNQETIIRSPTAEPPDRYYTSSTSQAFWAQRFGICVTDLDGQIARSANLESSP